MFPCVCVDSYDSLLSELHPPVFLMKGRPSLSLTESATGATWRKLYLSSPSLVLRLIYDVSFLSCLSFSGEFDFSPKYPPFFFFGGTHANSVVLVLTFLCPSLMGFPRRPGLVSLWILLPRGWVVSGEEPLMPPLVFRSGPGLRSSLSPLPVCAPDGVDCSLVPHPRNH